MTDDTTTTQDNIRPFRIVAANEAEAEATEDILPQNEYVITTLGGQEFFATGFMLFTSHHIAVMTETERGAMPVLVVPLTNVMAAEIVDEDEDEAPF